MTTLLEVLIAAIKSFEKGKVLVRAMLAYWISSTTFKGTGPDSIPTTTTTTTTTTITTALDAPEPQRSPNDFLKEAEEQLLRSVQGDALGEFSLRLKAQFEEGLLTNPACMLPSYNHQLPNRSEHGQYLALDVGGSTLRIALVELRGNASCANGSGDGSRILRLESFKIVREIKDLEGMAFFDWMAQKIVSTVSKAVGSENNAEKPLLMGMAWSFPIEQTSLKGGKLQGMGKGFLASHGLLGQDLGDIIKSACRSRGIHVELAAIVNDSTATLLSGAYANSSTRFGLILGTGVNIAVHLPVPCVGRDKFGRRPAGWFERASHVVVNTELGMFGKGILPVTRWDEALNEGHARPDFQPLEHLVSGCYLGEVCRLALVEAVATTGLFGGLAPPSLLKPYSLDTETISFIEADSSEDLEPSLALFRSRHPCAGPSEATTADLRFVRALASLISRRSSAIVAASLFALWQIKNEAEARYHHRHHRHHHAPEEGEGEKGKGPGPGAGRTVVAFNGSVIEQYPHYLQNCQAYLDALVSSAGGRPGAVGLVGAKESSLLGAAVALACLEEGKAN